MRFVETWFFVATFAALVVYTDALVPESVVRRGQLSLGRLRWTVDGASPLSIMSSSGDEETELFRESREENKDGLH